MEDWTEFYGQFKTFARRFGEGEGRLDPGSQIGNIADAVTKLLKNRPDFLDEFVKIIIISLVEEVGDLSGAADETIERLETPIKEASEHFGGILGKISGFLAESGEGFGVFPKPLVTGPKESVERLRQFGGYLKDANSEKERITNRFAAVVNSLTHLPIFEDDDQGRFPLVPNFKEIINALNEVFTNGADIKDLLTKIQKHLFPFDAVIKILIKGSEGKMQDWLHFPRAFSVGELYSWVNTNYKDVALKQIERQYRLGVVAIANHYFTSDQNSREFFSRPTHQRFLTTPELISGFLTTFIDYTCEFIFQPNCHSFPNAKLPHLRNLSIRFAEVHSGQLRLQIRSYLGVLLRGVWEFSLHSEALVELVATWFSVLFSSIIRGITLYVTQTAVIVNEYSGRTADSTRWITSGKTKTAEDGDRLQYAIYLGKDGHLEGEWPIIPPELQKLAWDFSSFQEAVLVHGANGDAFPESGGDRVTISRSELQSDGDGWVLIVEANSTFEDNSYGLPLPVVRLAFCCRVHVMEPPAATSAGSPYSIKVSCSEWQKGEMIRVFSNWGGSAESLIY